MTRTRFASSVAAMMLATLGADHVAAQGCFPLPEHLTAPGGLLIYCTCSLEPQEGERQIEKFLATHPDFARAPLSPDDLPGLPEAITAKGDMRTLPTFWADRGGMDGFFAARLKRTA